MLLHRDGLAEVLHRCFMFALFVLSPFSYGPSFQMPDTAELQSWHRHLVSLLQVAAIEPFKSRGLYAPLTGSGELEVNGFSTSCYASFPRYRPFAIQCDAAWLHMCSM